MSFPAVNLHSVNVWDFPAITRGEPRTIFGTPGRRNCSQLIISILVRWDLDVFFHIHWAQWIDSKYGTYVYISINILWNIDSCLLHLLISVVLKAWNHGHGTFRQRRRRWNPRNSWRVRRPIDKCRCAAARQATAATLERWLDSNHSQEKWRGKKGIVSAIKIHLEFLFSSTVVLEWLDYWNRCWW